LQPALMGSRTRLIRAKGDELQKAGATMLPSNILEAIAALESDNKFLKGILSSDLLESYLEDKIEEHKEQSARPTSYEFEKYFNL